MQKARDIFVGDASALAALQLYDSDPLVNSLIESIDRLLLPNARQIGLDATAHYAQLIKPPMISARPALLADFGIDTYEYDRRYHWTGQRHPELGFHALMGALDKSDISLNCLLESSKAAGGSTSLRDHGHGTSFTKSGHRIVFISATDVPSRMDLLIREIRSGSQSRNPICFAIEIMMELLIVHPLTDGNGRLARSLLNASVARHFRKNNPIFPLQAAFVQFRLELFYAFLVLELRGNSATLFRTMIELLENALDAMAKIVTCDSRCCSPVQN